MGFIAKCIVASLLTLSLTLCAASGREEGGKPVNLALNRPATSSSVENEEHDAAKANDGDPDTCWIADDEPEGIPDWWRVDLQKPADLSGCEIRWPYDGHVYRYRVEASSDGKSWLLLSDQTAARSKSQVHRLKFDHAAAVRFVKITVTRVEDGVGVGIAEVKVFGQFTPNGARE